MRFSAPEVQSTVPNCGSEFCFHSVLPAGQAAEPRVEESGDLLDFGFWPCYAVLLTVVLAVVLSVIVMVLMNVESNKR